MRHMSSIAAALGLVAASLAAFGSGLGIMKRPVETRYHGVTVVDDYQWLENGNDPRVREWSDAENARARAYLDRVPARPAIQARLDELTRSTAPAYSRLVPRGQRFFALKDDPPLQQRFIVVFDSLDEPAVERVLVDPNAIDPSGDTTIDFFEPSPDGELVAVSMSAGGTEDGTVSIFETATGRRLPDAVPGVNGGTAGGAVAWTADGQGFYHTRYPGPSVRAPVDRAFYQQIFHHRLGTAADDDVYALGREFPRIAEIRLATREGGPEILADVLNGDGGEHAFWLLDPGTGSWRQVTTFEDECVRARFGTGADQHLYLLSYSGTPNGKIIRLPLGTPELARAELMVEGGPVAIDDFAPTASRLYVCDLVGGPSRLRLFDLRGTQLGFLPLPLNTSVRGLVPLGGDGAAFERESFVEPGAWYRFDPTTWKVTATRLRMESPADFSDVEVRREFALSKDGTRIPLNILVRKGTALDGTAPAILYGYGGYGLAERPSFDPARRLWLEQGGVYAIANVRGGGEFGQSWHHAGNMTRKQNVFDDFAACAEYLIERRYTSRSRLAAEGASNGGTLMGATLVQHPELCRAIVSQVGVYDMLRVELTPNGEFITTEFGTVKDPDQFKALYAYSPYHNVRDGTPYPAVLLMTGDNDPRVDPMHSRKMTARLLAASASDHPILLRTSAHTGHGGGTPLSSRNAERADAYAFLVTELGVSYRPAADRSRP
jgi:prolyl oligopeptidase